MKRLLVLVIAGALLLPAVLYADGPIMGVFFSPGQMAASPPAMVPFAANIYLHYSPYYITAIEYQLLTPSDPTHAACQAMSVVYPDNKTVSFGSPFAGHSIAFWPPLNGYVPGYNWICTQYLMLMQPCWNDVEGTVVDYNLVIGPHPDSGYLRGTYSAEPNDEYFSIVGLTSLLCPLLEPPIAAEEKSWGAIKSLFE